MIDKAVDHIDGDPTNNDLDNLRLVPLDTDYAARKAEHEAHWRRGPVDGCPICRANVVEDARITDMLRDRYPGYAYDGRDGSIEAEDDDEDRIAAEDEERTEEWSEYLEWQRSLGA